MCGTLCCAGSKNLQRVLLFTPAAPSNVTSLETGHELKQKQEVAGGLGRALWGEGGHKQVGQRDSTH